METDPSAFSTLDPKKKRVVILANRFGQMLFAPATSSTTAFGGTRSGDERRNPLDELVD